MTTQGGSIKGSAKITADYNFFMPVILTAFWPPPVLFLFAGIADTVVQQYKAE